MLREIVTEYEETLRNASKHRMQGDVRKCQNSRKCDNAPHSGPKRVPKWASGQPPRGHRKVPKLMEMNFSGAQKAWTGHPRKVRARSFPFESQIDPKSDSTKGQKRVQEKPQKVQK